MASRALHPVRLHRERWERQGQVAQNQVTMGSMEVPKGEEESRGQLDPKFLQVTSIYIDIDDIL